MSVLVVYTPNKFKQIWWNFSFVPLWQRWEICLYLFYNFFFTDFFPLQLVFHGEYLLKKNKQNKNYGQVRKCIRTNCERINSFVNGIHIEELQIFYFNSHTIKFTSVQCIHVSRLCVMVCFSSGTHVYILLYPLCLSLSLCVFLLYGRNDNTHIHSHIDERK